MQFENENENENEWNENESLLIPAVKHDIYISVYFFKNKIDLRLTQIIKGTFFLRYT